MACTEYFKRTQSSNPATAVDTASNVQKNIYLYGCLFAIVAIPILEH